MALTIAAGDILAVRAWTVLDEQAAVNTWNYLCTNVVGGGITDQDLATQWDTLNGSPFYQFLCPPDVEYRGVQVYFMKRTGFLPAPSVSIAGAHVGVTGTTCLPRVAAGILKYNSFDRGPGGRGRIYLPFVSGDYAAANGRPTVAYDTLVNSFASGLLSPFVITSGGNSATFVWGILKKRTLPMTLNAAIAAESADKFGNLHKRGDYGKANASPI